MTRRFRCPAVRLKPCKHAPCCRLPPTVDARICILTSGGGGRVVGARPLPPVTRFVTVSYPTVSYRFVPDSYRFVPYMYRAHVDRNRAPYRAPTERRHERQRAATSAAPSVCPLPWSSAPMRCSVRRFALVQCSNEVLGTALCLVQCSNEVLGTALYMTEHLQHGCSCSSSSRCVPLGYGETREPGGPGCALDDASHPRRRWAVGTPTWIIPGIWPTCECCHCCCWWSR